MDDIDYAYCELDSLRSRIYAQRSKFSSRYTAFYLPPQAGSAYPTMGYIYLYGASLIGSDTWLTIPSKSDMMEYFGIDSAAKDSITYAILASSAYSVEDYFTKISQYDVAGKSALAIAGGSHKGTDFLYDGNISSLFLPSDMNGIFVYNSENIDPTIPEWQRKVGSAAIITTAADNSSPIVPNGDYSVVAVSNNAFYISGGEQASRFTYAAGHKYLCMTEYDSAYPFNYQEMRGESFNFTSKNESFSASTKRSAKEYRICFIYEPTGFSVGDIFAFGDCFSTASYSAGLSVRPVKRITFDMTDAGIDYMTADQAYEFLRPAFLSDQGAKIIRIIYNGPWKDLGTINITSNPYRFFNPNIYKNCDIVCSDVTKKVRGGALMG